MIYRERAGTFSFDAATYPALTPDGRAFPWDPWWRSAEPALHDARRALDEDKGLGPARESALLERAWHDQDDPRPRLLLARLAMRDGMHWAALHHYERAHVADARARGHVPMLRDLVAIAASPKPSADSRAAVDALVAIYGSEAWPELEHRVEIAARRARGAPTPFRRTPADDLDGIRRAHDEVLGRTRDARPAGWQVHEAYARAFAWAAEQALALPGIAQTFEASANAYGSVSFLPRA